MTRSPPLHKPSHSPQTVTPVAARFETGIKYADDGPVCERHDGVGGCFLDAQQRHAVIEDINRHAALAAISYQTALQNARVDLLLKKPHSLPVFASLLLSAMGEMLTLGAGALIGGVVSYLTIKEVWDGERFDIASVTKGRTDLWKKVVSEGVTAGKTEVKSRFEGADPANASKVRFIAMLQDSVAPMLNSCVRQVLDNGDDVLLLLTRTALDPAVATVSSYSAHVQAILARFQAQGLDKVGAIDCGGVQNGTTEVVRLRANGHTRLAVIRFQEGRLLGRSNGDNWYLPRGPEFVSWVDDDFQDTALDIQAGVFGQAKSVDVSSDPRQYGAEVASWVHASRGGAQ